MPAAAQPSHDEALRLLREAANTGDIRAVVAYERAMWRDARDSEAAGKKDQNKKSRAEGILDSI